MILGGRQRGQALVELAVVFITLCSLCVTAYDFGQVMNIYLVTIHATREAARVASVAGTTVSAVQTAAQNAAADSVAASALTVSCQSATYNAASGTYALGGACQSPLPADSAFVVKVSTTVSPVLPFTGLLFGSMVVGPTPVSYSLVGIVEPSS